MTALAMQAFQGLASNRLFEGIEPALLSEIVPEVNVIQLEGGEVIFREGDQGICFISSARVGQNLKIRQGRSAGNTRFIQSGNFFGEMALLDGKPRSAMATAAEPTLARDGR